jgi:hypothetical protein
VELVWLAAGYDGVEATVEYLPQDHGFLPRRFLAKNAWSPSHSPHPGQL